MSVPIPDGTIIKTEDVPKYFEKLRAFGLAEPLVLDDDPFRPIKTLLKCGYAVKFPRKTYDGRLKHALVFADKLPGERVVLYCAIEHHDLDDWWLTFSPKEMIGVHSATEYLVEEFL